ncbi:hypothetical protein [Ideonella sp.]|uniref:hypothetical protein n=1 Tax=Ideonella sp. TaxID=1929293 RepID=UPI002B45C0B8|nr:hypothetical protein [Ideonella sp.]HJV71226.1 hypothetical protein [Ideonella sp.]
MTTTESHLESANAKEPRSAGLLSVDLGPALKAAWRAHCDALGVKAGPAICALVEASLKAPEAASARGASNGAMSGVGRPLASPALARLGCRPDHGPKVPREIALTPTEDAAIKDVCASQGLGYQAWLVAAVRAALTQTPTFGQAEMEALTASNALLAGVAIDLAQWRRQVAETALADRLESLEATIKRHVELSSRTMAQGTRRWEITV